MLKDILINCTQILCRDDLTQTLQQYSNVDDIDNESVKNDILRLINYFNYTSNYISENYLELLHTQVISSDNEGKIYFYNFCFSPVRIFSVLTEMKKQISFETTPNYIKVKSPNTDFLVTYKYTLNECNNLESTPNFPDNFNIEILCYGIVSEFLACKGQFAESEFWSKKFLNRLFKSKLKKERRLKSTFNK